jgi:hypothetical protein
VGVSLKGFTELRETLKALPADLVREAGPIVQTAGEAAAREIIAAYPTGPTGNLKRGVRVEVHADAGSTWVQIRSTAKHAYLYERGSAVRHWANGKNTGQMPAAHVFIPIAIVQRARMVAALIDFVERAGLTVAVAA